VALRDDRAGTNPRDVGVGARDLVAVWIRNSRINSLVANQRILEWSKRYAQQCYDLVGIADISAAGTTMVWDREAASYQPRSQDLIYTLRRKSDAPCKVQLSQ
jgi:hypothetical protein